MLKDKKGLKGFFLGIFVSVIVIALFFLGQNAYHKYISKDLTVSEKLNAINSVLSQNFVGDYNSKDLEENMYRGLVAGIKDRYTVYMDKNTFTSFSQNSDGTYAGIGATVMASNDNKVQIVSTFPTSPADKAGIKPGDEILKINGTAVTGDKLESAVALMKGPESTKVTITILHKADNNTSDVEVLRSKIDIPTVTHKMMDNKIGYIRITSFDGVTYDQYETAYNDLKNQGMEKLIIDLRDNPGGLLNIVCKIANTIVPKGVIVYTEDKNGNKQYQYSDENHIQIPLAVLVNGYSASASEVLTEAIKDYGVGTIVGEKTFGKGVVQGIFPLSDGSAVKVTMSKYYSPKGVCIQGIGIEPDVVVPYDETKDGSTFNLTYDKDVQLQKAVEIVNTQKK